MMSGAKKMVPKRRFKEFLNAGDWEQRKLGSIGSTYTGLSGKTKEDFGHGEAKYITYLNVFQNTISNITMTDKVEIDPTQNEVKYGDVLFTTSSETPEEVGMSSVWLGDTPNIYLNSFCFGFRPNQKIDSYFLGYSLRAPYMRDKIKILAQGISRYNISKNKVMELEISLPNNEEQKLLGTFLQRIDLIITLHQRKLDKLQATKKALLQEMFPEGGQDKPKRRFKGFTDAWEQRKLGDIATITGGGTPSTNISEYWNGDIDWYSPVEIGEKRYASGSIRKITKLGLEKCSAKILPVGTVLFTSRAGIGNTAILQVEGCTNQGFQSITPNSKELDTYFLYTMTPKLKRYGEVTGAGSTFVEVSGKQMEQMNLMIPSIDEQKHVSQLFKVMDDAITLYQRKLDKLKNLKRAYLNELFV